MPNNQIKSLTVDGVTYDIVDETSGYMKGMTILSYGNSTWQDFLTAYNEQKVVYCRASSQSNPASGEQTRLAFMAYVNDADTPTEVEFQYYRSVNTHTEAQQGDQVFVYKLTSAGNWTVTTREASVKVAASGDLTGSYSNGVYTISGDIPTIAVEPKITTGVNIADITVDETTYELYAPTGGGGSVESVAVSNATNGGLSVSGSPITSSGTITIGHSNVLTSAQTTQAVYPIKIDKNGHISAYGSAVYIPTDATDIDFDNSIKEYLSSNDVQGAIDELTDGISWLDDNKADYATSLAGYGITDAKIENNVITLGTNSLNLDNYVKNYSNNVISSYILPYNGEGWGEIIYRNTGNNNDNTAVINYGTTSGNNSSYISLSADSITLSGNISASNNKIINLGTPTTNTDAATKGYVDSSIPTKTSDLTNDSGYIIGSNVPSNETDPTVPSWAKASTKPSYTASEVGAAATSHAHGNITSGGDITATAPTIANGDQIVINDSSASKITNGPTFDGSTINKYLSPKGTWENIPDSDDIVIVEYDVDTYSTVATAITNGKEVICKLPGDVSGLGTGIYSYLILSTYDLEYEYIVFSTAEYWDNNEAVVYTAYLSTAEQPWEFMTTRLNNSSNTGGYFYGDSSTAASTETKEISLIKESFDGIYSIIAVYFNYGNTANAPKLKINDYDTQGIPVYYRGVATSSGNKLLWNDGDTLIFMSIPGGYAFISKVAPSSATSSTTGISISNHSTGSVTGVQSSTTTASKVTLGTAISVPNVTAAGSGSFTQGSFSGGSLTFAIDSTDNKQLNITFTAATHGADSHTHTPPTLGTAKSIPNVTTVSDVTVPIKNTSATTVVTSATHTVTDNGHTHSLS